METRENLLVCRGGAPGSEGHIPLEKPLFFVFFALFKKNIVRIKTLKKHFRRAEREKIGKIMENF